MLEGVERLVVLSGTQTSALTGATSQQIEAAVLQGDWQRLNQTDGHFAAVQRDGKTVRMARTLGVPLRYLVAKMYHGPFLVVGQRMDQLFAWCREQRIGWQFDPMYTRMVPAHYLVELDQVGCPDPAPRYQRFFNPSIGKGSADIEESGAQYIAATYEALKTWLANVPAHEPIALAFSGGVDSTSVFLLARKALEELGSDPSRLRAFTLDLGEGRDAQQAVEVVRKLGLEEQWEVVNVPAEKLNLEEAIRVIEDYHPLDVECAAVSLCLLEGIRERYPSLKYLIDGDGGDENLKAYPLEDSDLTISSVLGNPLLYQEGWGIDAIKHSLTYSGGLSRGYVRTYAPAQHFGFEAFSPYTVRSVIAEALAIPFENVIGESAERLMTLKADVVSVGVKAVTGVTMPVFPKRRFQEGAGGESYRQWRVGKSWCRQVFLRQWQERLREAWEPDAERRSGNEMTVTEARLIV
ncbi:MAG TPA: asparagine synthase-related protein [Blastocatellia bacterium]|nr:asparagine synthase-related protein [Blastocatellia bacterium]HMY75128.1 asparagine synthase-related protein [Blastocatellia bacterium]HNG34534.1 asparagine synthase-related protein [Blastocatellia bacterium]